MTKLSIALLSGGISSERDVSIASGNQVYETLDRDKYEVIRYDPKTDLPRLVADAAGIDAALIILHGPYGEDGTVQGLLDLLDIPYQGSGVLGSAIGMNKLVSKQLYKNAGIPVAPDMTFKSIDMIETRAVVDQLGMPLVIKPVTSGSSIGLSIVKSEDALNDALEKAFAEDHEVLIESYIKGVELTGGVIGNQELQALPIVEIIPGEEFYFFVHEPHCLGFEEDEMWTVRDWRKDQGVDIHDEINAGWTDLIVRKRSFPPNIEMTEQSKKLFFLVSYNIDKLRQFVFESSFLDRYEVDADTVEKIRKDEVALLKFGMKWLRSVFFKGGEFQVKEDAAKYRKKSDNL